jgi:hypothetical protein
MILEKNLRASLSDGGTQVTTSTPTSVTVGAASTQVLAANASRLQAVLVNNSDEEIYYAKGASAVLNAGVRLNAYGGSATINGFKGAINAICASGGKNLSVMEDI